MTNSAVRAGYGIRSAAIGLAPVRVLNAVRSTPFSAAVELRTMICSLHPCLRSQSDISPVRTTARTVLAAPKAGNLEEHFAKARPSMVAAAAGG